MSRTGHKRSLIEMAYEATKNNEGVPRPRELLVRFGRPQAEVDAMNDKDMWEAFAHEFGGIKWTTMRELNKLDPTADAQWFHTNKCSYTHGEAMLQHALDLVAKEDVGIKTPEGKKPKYGA